MAKTDPDDDTATARTQVVGTKVDTDPDAGVIVTEHEHVFHWYPNGTDGVHVPPVIDVSDEQRARWAAAEAAGTPAEATSQESATTKTKASASA